MKICATPGENFGGSDLGKEDEIEIEEESSVPNKEKRHYPLGQRCNHGRKRPARITRFCLVAYPRFGLGRNLEMDALPW